MQLEHTLSRSIALEQLRRMLLRCVDFNICWRDIRLFLAARPPIHDGLPSNHMPQGPAVEVIHWRPGSGSFHWRRGGHELVLVPRPATRGAESASLSRFTSALQIHCPFLLQRIVSGFSFSFSVQRIPSLVHHCVDLLAIISHEAGSLGVWLHLRDLAPAKTVPIRTRVTKH